VAWAAFSAAAGAMEDVVSANNGKDAMEKLLFVIIGSKFVAAGRATKSLALKRVWLLR
jgi:hypothetical protein